ncbi:putative nucleotidyltransferase substrate binding domain-containing protein [Alkalilimnicola sp. S0819]|uniref:putative nucleotidyltransferase substrate binding domain-containing protein n=1 Tax=Alkalilimnicola sp. S0819 TaxID=2613922 RepID=UPI00126204DA|nr:putative nucleotidyltransferase substrate binding domain-containing protein [Alkalilimnicola sp. S0819]KAB7624364.1 CBS domain-containing protein [Alkalilimnicola sp. S0819]MPQ16190.1 CBS domain-containing protein [Alkalilimnicola sp. S0819]
MADDSYQAREAVRQNLAGLGRFLAQHEPFDQLTDEQLQTLLGHARLGFHAAEQTILAPDEGRVRQLYIVKQGLVRGERPSEGETRGQLTLELHPGEAFPIGALLGERPTRTLYRAAEDSFCLSIPQADFATVFQANAAFRDFCLRGISSLMQKVGQQLRGGAAERAGGGDGLDTPLAALIRRPPVTAPPELGIRQAVSLMHRENVGSVVITDARQRPLGVFTLHDLRRVVADAQPALDTPLKAVMSTRLRSLPPAAYAFDAAVYMAGEGIRHMLVVEHGRLRGVVSERDLFALQRVSLVNLARCINAADSVPALGALRPRISELIDAMLIHGAAAEQINKLITTLNDRMVSRCITLCQARHGDTPAPFSWLAFGSEGRREQTLHTDQDNGILFEPPPGENTERLRQRLLPLARDINQALADVGLSLCKGNIMAGNPALCLSAVEWREHFHGIVAQCTPENLLRSAIFFDLRHIHGPAEPVERLQREMLALARGNSLFQHMLAANALHSRPPLGLLRDFVTRDQRLDLKVQGLTPFVDSARVLALAHGVTETGTPDRLRALERIEAINAREGRAWRDAYGFVQSLRLRLHERQQRAGEPLSNQLDPDNLNPLERRILKEAFRQARSLQRRLASEFQLSR